MCVCVGVGGGGWLWVMCVCVSVCGFVEVCSTEKKARVLTRDWRSRARQAKREPTTSSRIPAKVRSVVG